MKTKHLRTSSWAPGNTDRLVFIFTIFWPNNHQRITDASLIDNLIHNENNPFFSQQLKFVWTTVLSSYTGCIFTEIATILQIAWGCKTG